MNSEKHLNKQSKFERFSETISTFVARPPFLVVVCVVIFLWISAQVFDISNFEHLTAEFAALLTLLVVVFLQNEALRADYVLHQKLDRQAEALAWLLQAHELQPDLVHQLQDSVGLEERV